MNKSSYTLIMSTLKVRNTMKGSVFLDQHQHYTVAHKFHVYCTSNGMSWRDSALCDCRSLPRKTYSLMCFFRCVNCLISYRYVTLPVIRNNFLPWCRHLLIHFHFHEWKFLHPLHLGEKIIMTNFAFLCHVFRNRVKHHSIKRKVVSTKN